jgi:hypothetical protein
MLEVQKISKTKKKREISKNFRKVLLHIKNEKIDTFLGKKNIFYFFLFYFFFFFIFFIFLFYFFKKVKYHFFNGKLFTISFFVFSIFYFELD